MTGKEAAEICNRFGITARKRWGQNFLCSDEITGRIVDAAGITAEDSVLEIGPGLGALTEKLCDRSQHVLAVEIDPVLADYLSKRFAGSSRFSVIREDYLKLHADRVTERIGRPQVIVSNLPYNLTTPIVSRLLTDYPDAGTMLFMVEEDACARIFSSPGQKTYGPLSVISSVFGEKEKLFSVAPHHFFPAPHTVSAVIRFSRKTDRAVIPDGFVTFVREAMSSGRKTLINALGQSGGFSKDAAKIRDYLSRNRIMPNVRAESLQPADFLSLYQELRPNI